MLGTKSLSTLLESVQKRQLHHQAITWFFLNNVILRLNSHVSVISSIYIALKMSFLVSIVRITHKFKKLIICVKKLKQVGKQKPTNGS